MRGASDERLKRDAKCEPITGCLLYGMTNISAIFDQQMITQPAFLLGGQNSRTSLVGGTVSTVCQDETTPNYENQVGARTRGVSCWQSIENAVPGTDGDVSRRWNNLMHHFTSKSDGLMRVWVCYGWYGVGKVWVDITVRTRHPK